VLFTRRAWRCLMLLAEYESIAWDTVSFIVESFVVRSGITAFTSYVSSASGLCPFMIPLHCDFPVSRPQGFSV
jgi:hypothetical protein